jgi:hypothetical protein
MKKIIIFMFIALICMSIAFAGDKQKVHATYTYDDIFSRDDKVSDLVKVTSLTQSSNSSVILLTINYETIVDNKKKFTTVNRKAIVPVYADKYNGCLNSGQIITKESLDDFCFAVYVKYPVMNKINDLKSDLIGQVKKIKEAKSKTKADDKVFSKDVENKIKQFKLEN